MEDMKKTIFGAFLAISVVLLGSQGAMAISKVQKDAISDYCGTIKEALKSVQKDDARVRVHLGGRYETILSKFIVPLNVRLVEQNLSNAELVENQNKYAEAKAAFTSDYVNYQQKLEELITVDCKNNPSEFYEQLGKVREKRKTVEQDVVKLKNLISRHKKLVTALKDKI